ncbi:MAG: hypothetical protein V4496_03555 [Pseudomonadota bacterium]
MLPKTSFGDEITKVFYEEDIKAVKLKITQENIHNLDQETGSSFFHVIVSIAIPDRIESPQQLAILVYLLELVQGACIEVIDHVDNAGNTALEIAVKNGHTNMVALFLGYGAEIIDTKKACKLFLLACQYGHLRIIQLFQKTRLNFDFSGKVQLFSDAIMCLMNAGHLKMAELLFPNLLHDLLPALYPENYQPLSFSSKSMESSAHVTDSSDQISASNDPLETYKQKLLERGFANTEDGNPLLHVLIWKKHKQQEIFADAATALAILVFVIALGADLEAPNRSYQTALYLAVYTKQVDVIALLVGYGAQIGGNNKQINPFLLACSMQDAKMIQVLLNTTGKNGQNFVLDAIGFAFIYDYIEMIPILLPRSIAGLHYLQTKENNDSLYKVMELYINECIVEESVNEVKEQVRRLIPLHYIPAPLLASGAMAEEEKKILFLVKTLLDKQVVVLHSHGTIERVGKSRGVLQNKIILYRGCDGRYDAYRPKSNNLSDHEMLTQYKKSSQGIGFFKKSKRAALVPDSVFSSISSESNMTLQSLCFNGNDRKRKFAETTQNNNPYCL